MSDSCNDKNQVPVPPIKLEFSGTTCDGSPWHKDWLAFTDSEYYHRCRNIMLDYGMGGGDVEMILANFWESGWIAGSRTKPQLDNNNDNT